MTKNIFKKILMILLMTTMLLITGNVFSQAVSFSGSSIGKSVSLKFSDLTGSSNLYCVQHHAPFKGTRQYVVQRYVKITGNVATNDNGKSVTSDKNAILAYILGGGNYSKGYGSSTTTHTQRQNALWGYFNTWSNSVGSSLGVNWSYSRNGNNQSYNVTKEAKNYANSTTKASIKNMGAETVVTSNTMAGPFRVSYSGSISSIDVVDTSNSKISSGIKFYVDNKAVSASQIKSNEKFYIKNDSGKNLKEVTINVTANSTINAEIWFLKAKTGSKWQRLISVKTNTSSTSDKVTIGIVAFGSLKINKIDADTGDKLNVGFKIRTSKGWLKDVANSDEHIYDAKYEDATEYKTVNGQLTISNLEYRTYGVYEVKVDESKGYNITKQKNYDSKNKWIHYKDILIDGTKNQNVEITVTNEKYGSLTINKVDEDNNDVKLRAGFKIYSVDNKKWLKGTKGSYTYNNSEAQADTYYTDENSGSIIIEQLQFGKYEVYETVPPKGYDLAAQKGYKDGKVLVGTADFEANKKTITFTHKNSDLISISGYVWIDVPETKNNDTDSLYNGVTGQNEVRVSGVQVRLMKKTDGKPVEGVNPVYTNKNGEYIFEKKVSNSALKDYYVEFDYSGTEYKQYIPVAFNSEKIDNIVANGSRAIVKEMPEKDTDFKGIATTYTGTEKEKEEKYGLSTSGNLYSKLYNKDTKTLENINLGIKQVPEVDYRIEENLAYVKVVMKGYTYTYQYGGTGDTSKIAAPTVSWQSKNRISAYTRAIYPSDISYDIENSKEELKVYVVYRIDITNTTAYNIEELYKEQKLHITNVTNNFDKNRYELHDKNWSVEADGKASIASSYLEQIYGKGIAKDKTSTSFIEFSVKHDAIEKILNNPTGIIEEFPTEVTANGYHEYERQDYSWKNDIRKNQKHYKNDIPRSAKAPYLILKLGEERTIFGKVFEDRVVTTNGEKLGNGAYDTGENVVKGVTVELLDVNGNETDITKLTVSNLYGVNNSTTISKEAKIETDENGEYKLIGVVPGEYYLRFTYGDGKQILYDPSTKKEVKTILAKDYKSTIVTSDVAKKALQGVEDASTVKQDKFVTEKGTSKKKNYIWYKNLEGTNYSVAVDNMDSRNTANATEATVKAGTARLSITLENTKSNVASATTTQAEDGTTTLTFESNQEFGGLNFGIIEQPNQEAKVDKVITNIKLTNTQNNLIFDGNPETANIKGVSDLDNTKNGGSTYTRAELSEESIYGSTLVVTYAIKVTNISDVNYYSDKYYWFGDKDGAYEVTLKINEVTDYLDETLKYIPESSDKNNITVTTDSIEETEVETTIKKYIVKITGWDALYTEKNRERTTEKQTSDTVNITAQRILSNQDDDMEVVNEAEITDAVRNADPDDPDRKKEEKIQRAPVVVNTNGKVRAIVTITPPTGEDRQSIALYLIAGVVTLAILSTGIVLIKKKVV